MHIGFDVSQTGSGKAGCGYFAHQLAVSLLAEPSPHDWTFYPSFGDFWFDPRMVLARAPAPARMGPRHVSRSAASRFWNAPLVESPLGHPQVVHANNFWCPTQMREARVVYTCYDLGFLVEPGWTSEENRAGCFEGMFRASLAADWIVAISEATRAHFLSAFPHFPAERVRVVYPSSRYGSNSARRRPRALAALEPGRFWLNVGTLEPRKNQHRLAAAYAAYLARGGPVMPLVLAGGKGWLMDDFAGHLRRLGIADRVVLAGYVDDDELAWLYANCYANLYPSRFEGFGLPVLEAMHLGAACIVSDASSLPEVAGSSALLVPPGDPAAWTEAMLRLAADPTLRARLRAAGPVRAAEFSAAASARRLLALYEEAVAAPKRLPLREAA